MEEKKSLDIPPLIYPNGIVKNILRHFSQLLNVPITRTVQLDITAFLKTVKKNKHKFIRPLFTFLPA